MTTNTIINDFHTLGQLLGLSKTETEELRFQLLPASMDGEYDTTTTMQEQVFAIANPYAFAVDYARNNGIDNCVFDAELEASKAIQKWLELPADYFTSVEHAWASCKTYIINAFRHYSEYKQGLRWSMRSYADFAEASKSIMAEETNTMNELLVNVKGASGKLATEPAELLALLIERLPSGKLRDAVYLRMTLGKHFDASYQRAYSRAVVAMRNMLDSDLTKREAAKLGKRVDYRPNISKSKLAEHNAKLHWWKGKRLSASQSR